MVKYASKKQESVVAGIVKSRIRPELVTVENLGANGDVSVSDRSLKSQWTLFLIGPQGGLKKQVTL